MSKRSALHSCLEVVPSTTRTKLDQFALSPFRKIFHPNFSLTALKSKNASAMDKVSGDPEKVNGAESVSCSIEGASKEDAIFFQDWSEMACFLIEAFNERLAALMAEREEKLAEIKNRVGSLETKTADNPLVNAENSLHELHSRMKKIVADLGEFMVIFL